MRFLAIDFQGEKKSCRQFQGGAMALDHLASWFKTNIDHRYI